MKSRTLVGALAGPLLIVVVAAMLWSLRSYFLMPDADMPELSNPADEAADLQVLELSAAARQNLGLRAAAARPTDYWRTITIPGIVQDRPGVSDRGVTSPAVGAIAAIHVYPGDTIHPGERLVTLQLFSEYLQSTQTQLFKAAEEIGLLRTEIQRLSSAAETGGISGSRIIELENDVRRQETLAAAARQELLNRGFAPQQVQRVSLGEFVSTIDVVAPPLRAADEPSPLDSPAAAGHTELAYEVQSLAVELGQTVQAGQLIADLADHRSLYVVGHAFKREAGFLEQAAQQFRPIDIVFADDASESWPPLQQEFHIRHLSNSIDPNSRTFDFFIPLSNPSRSYERNGETFLVWRFRPGQRARIRVPVEQLSDVFVLPAEAVVFEGPEAFVYQQNGDLFNQLSVHVLYQDRMEVVIANDGNITPGTYLAQNAAASLRRVLKAQSSSGQQPGVHVHADGSVHAAH